MAKVVLGRDWEDEYEVSDFAHFAYLGDVQAIKEFAKTSADFKDDFMSLYLSLRSGNKNVLQCLLDLGVHIPASFYAHVLYENPSFLEILPTNEEAIAMARAKQKSFELSYGLLSGKLEHREIRELIYQGADARNPVLVNTGHRSSYPIHLATRHPKLTVFKELMRAGVNPAMENAAGKNAVRMIYESQKLTRKERKEFKKFFSHHDLEPKPKLSLSEKIRFALGLALNNGTRE